MYNSLLIRHRFEGNRRELRIHIFAYRVTWNYANSPFNYVFPDPFGLLNKIEQFAVAKIQTRQSFIKNNVPNINGKYGLNRYKYNPAMYYISPLFTRGIIEQKFPNKHQ